MSVLRVCRFRGADNEYVNPYVHRSHPLFVWGCCPVSNRLMGVEGIGGQKSVATVGRNGPSIMGASSEANAKSMCLSLLSLPHALPPLFVKRSTEGTPR